jgi:hypothetical protein
VGKDVFNIAHYWVRFEFAPSRGQIHAHMLATCADQKWLKDMYAARHDPAKKVKIAEKWAETLGMTASVSDKELQLHGDNTIREFDASNHPAGTRYKDATDKEVDCMNLIHAVQYHKCTGYCMKPDPEDPQGNFICRFGCGREATKGQCDTEGYELTDNTHFGTDKNREKIYLPRNHRRIVQTSTHVLQSWRANCDVAILLYDTDPETPDPKTIGKLTDYVVSYTCKGTATLQQERNISKAFIDEYTETTDDESDVSRMVCKILNKMTSSRLIPLQEVLVILLDLNLVLCSEMLDTISLFSKAITTSSNRGNSIISRYCKRPSHLEDYSLFDYFHKTKNGIDKGGLKNWKKDGHKIDHIPFVPGSGTTAVYPPTLTYSKCMLSLYKPMRSFSGVGGIDPIGNFLGMMHTYKSSRMGFMIRYETAISDYYRDTPRVEPLQAPTRTRPEEMTEEDIEREQLTTLHNHKGDEDGNPQDGDFEYGLNYAWDAVPADIGVSHYVVSFFDFVCKGKLSSDTFVNL